MKRKKPSQIEALRAEIKALRERIEALEKVAHPQAVMTPEAIAEVVEQAVRKAMPMPYAPFSPLQPRESRWPYNIPIC